MVRNANAAQLRQSLEEFSANAARARMVIVYFAGHGFEFAGRNYMVPVDAPASTRFGAVERDFVSLEALAITAVPEGAVGIFFVDACRTVDPVVRLDDNVTSGLPTLPVSALSIDQGAVFYSTARGRPALDQAPPGSLTSPFAAALVRHMTIPGVEIAQMFRNVAREVVSTTTGLEHGPQWPQQQVNLLDSVFLVPAGDQPARDLSTLATGDAAARAAFRLEQSASRAPGGHAATRGAVTQAIVLPSLERLSAEDEPQLIAELLVDHGALEIVSLAQNGNVAAQHLAGYMYAFGVGVARDDAAALSWLERSAATGYAPAQLELGYFLLERSPMDGAARARAEQLYRAAAASGYAKAKTHLAQRIASGLFGPPDHAGVRRLYQEAAAAGHGAAIFALVGYEDLRDDMMARLRTMAQNGNVEGDNWLCEAAAMERRVAESLPHCETAALAGYAGARVIFARALADGTGTAIDRPAAIYWANLARAQPELGLRATVISDIVSP